MPRTPPPVEGRMHMDVQTDDFLEELTDRPVEVSMETQTEAFMDRPPSPLFVPGKSGIDADTQVVIGELFEFDLEVCCTTQEKVPGFVRHQIGMNAIDSLSCRGSDRVAN